MCSGSTRTSSRRRRPESALARRRWHRPGWEMRSMRFRKTPDSSPAPAGDLRPLDPDRLTEHTDALYRAAWALSGSRHDAEDLVQETFAAVLKRPRWIHPGGE